MILKYCQKLIYIITKYIIFKKIQTINYNIYIYYKLTYVNKKN